MLTSKQKSIMLNRVVELLEEADALQQKVLGACDVCEDNHNRIQDVIDDVISDIVELDDGEQV